MTDILSIIPRVILHGYLFLFCTPVFVVLISVEVVCQRRWRHLATKYARVDKLLQVRSDPKDGKKSTFLNSGHYMLSKGFIWNTPHNGDILWDVWFWGIFPTKLDYHSFGMKNTLYPPTVQQVNIGL